MHDGTKIQLIDGTPFDYANIAGNHININAIAWALSMQCRFAGHLPKFYSVAQHCLVVSRICDPRYALEGLLHDASEAFVVDVPSPLKHMTTMKNYRNLEEQVHQLVFNTFHLTYPMPNAVKLADKQTLAWEFASFRKQTDFMWFSVEDYERIKNWPTIKPMTPKKAYEQYLQRFNKLWNAYHVK